MSTSIGLRLANIGRPKYRFEQIRVLGALFARLAFEHHLMTNYALGNEGATVVNTTIF